MRESARINNESIHTGSGFLNVGDVFVLMITNVAQTAQEIRFQKTSGDADTDCPAAQTEAGPEPALYMHPRCCSSNMSAHRAT